MEEEKVADDMARLTNGAVQLNLSEFTFERVQQNEPQSKRANGKKRK